MVEPPMILAALTTGIFELLSGSRLMDCAARSSALAFFSQAF